MCGGNKQQTTKSSTSALPEYASAYSDLLSKAQGAASTPYNPETNQQVAGFTPTQNQAFGAVQNNQGSYLPNLSAAGSSVAAGSSPVSTSSILSNYNPFISAQVSALQGDLANQNAQTLQASNSNAAKIGALTGDRSQVAAQIAQDSNNRNAALATSQLQSNAFGQAANISQGNQQAALQGANIYGNLAGQTQQLGLNDIASLLATGNQQQQQQQNVYNANTSNAQAESAYPFNVTQWLSGLTTGLGGAAGSNSSQTTPGPNMWSQLLGAGLSAASMFNRGGRVGYDSGGAVAPAIGGMPYAGARSYVPSVTMSGGSRPAPTPSLGSQTQDSGMSGVLDNFKQAKSAFQGMGSLGSKAFNWANTSTDPNSGWSTTTTPSGVSGISNYLTNTFGFSPFADGGMVHGYDDGGVVDDIPYGPWDQASPTGSENDSWSPIVSPAPPLPAPMGLGAVAHPAPQERAAEAPMATPYQLPQNEGLFGLKFSDAARQGLLAAGLGMMASRSPFVGSAIGEGGLAGIRSYSDVKQQAVENAQSKSRIDQEAARLQQTAKQASDQLKYNYAQLNSEAPLRAAQTANLNMTVQNRNAALASLKSPEFEAMIAGLPPEYQAAAKAAAAQGDVQSIMGLVEKTKPTISNGMILNPLTQTAMDPMSGMSYDLRTGNRIDTAASTTPAPGPNGEPPKLDDYLQTIPDAGMRGKVAAVLRGDDTLANISSRNPHYGSAVQRFVYGYDPTYSPQDAGYRKEYRDNLTKGDLSKQGNYIGTMAEHLNTAIDRASKLPNGQYPMWNALQNKFDVETGNPAQIEAAIALNNYAAEYAKVIKGGPPAEGEIAEQRSLLNSNMSKEGLQGALRTFEELANGRVHQMESKGHQVLGKYWTPKDSILTPFATDALGKVAANPWLHPDAGPPQEAILLLRQNPDAVHRASFDKYFGAGASDKILSGGSQ